MKRIAAGIILLACLPEARADVRLPAVISDHAVLQRDCAVPIWGWADPGEEITVTLGKDSKATKAGDDGRWQVRLERLPAGGPHTLQVKGKNTLTVNDVLVGEVWLASGQSNMAMTVSRCKDFDQEKAAANYPALRMFREASGPATAPQAEGKGAWQVCSPETVGGFSGTAYFFGREIHKALGVPVGLINSSVGGTPVEAWTSGEAQKGHKELTPLFERWDKMAASFDPEKAQATYKEQLGKYREAAKKAKEAGKPAPAAPRQPGPPRLSANHPATLFNGKIAPLVPYALRGAIWYQGESNANKGGAANYGLQLRLLVEDWRTRWGQGDFPFAWVQLPNFRKPQAAPVEDSDWAVVREQMTRTLALPNTGMAVTVDVGEANDIHPRNKQDVGRRLAMWALADVYKQRGVTASGPLYDRHEVREGEVVISFRHAEGGLVAKGDGLAGFAVAGEDGRWVAAKARIDGSKVVVGHPDVKKPVAVRYGWADNPPASVFNKAGLPASPFRTDGK